MKETSQKQQLAELQHRIHELGKPEAQCQVFLALCKFCFTLVHDTLSIDSYELKR